MDYKTSGEILHELSKKDSIVKLYYGIMRQAKTPEQVTDAWVSMTQALVHDKIILQKRMVDLINKNTSEKYIVVTPEMYKELIDKTNGG
jgi:hypothetical protein